MRRILLLVAAAGVWVAGSAAPASAHSVSGVSATNFHTRLTSVSPEIPGLRVRVVESGSRLELENRTGSEVLVLGYKDEPYLRVGPDGVYQNRLSTATYINASRDGEDPPESAKNAAAGATDWEQISSEPVARWHDHRIHWMQPDPPSFVRSDPGRRHVIDADWEVKLDQGDEIVSVRGELVWEPGPSPLPWYGLAGALAALVVLAGRGAGWARGLAAATAGLVAVDMFHALGLGLANAGSLGERLAKSVTESPIAVPVWILGAVAVVLLLRGRSPDRESGVGLPLVAAVGLLVALVGGVSDAGVLSHSEVPFGFAAGWARLAVAASIGLGFGLAVAVGLRLAGTGRAANPAAVSGGGISAPSGS